MRTWEGLAELLDTGTTGDAAAGVAIPYIIIHLSMFTIGGTMNIARVEHIRRVAVHVDPWALVKCGVWREDKCR